MCTQQNIADLIARSNYSRVETGKRDLSIDAVNKIARYFNMTIDQLINLEGEIPQDITIEDKEADEQLRFILLLDDDDRIQF